MTTAVFMGYKTQLNKGQQKQAKRLVVKILNQLQSVTEQANCLVSKIYLKLGESDELRRDLDSLGKSVEARCAAIQWAIEQLIKRRVVLYSVKRVQRGRGQANLRCTLTLARQSPPWRPHRDKYEHLKASVLSVA